MQMGTEAAEVFPYLCTLLNVLCSGILAYSAIASRIRWFAWWNRKKSTSSGVSPLDSSDSRMTSLKRRTAWVKMPRPFIVGLARPSSIFFFETIG